MSSPRLPLRPNLPFRLNHWAQDRVAPVAKQTVDVDYVFDVVPDAEERVRHRLARTPTGFRVVSQDRAGTVYHSPTGTAHDRNHLYLKSSVGGLTVRLEVF